MRWALTGATGVERLAPFMTVSGVHVLRIPDYPAEEPSPDQVGLYHRTMTQPMIRFLGALSPKQRELLATRQVVNISNVRDELVQLLGGGTRDLPADLIRSCPALAVSLEIVPGIRVRPGGGATSPQSEAFLHYHGPTAVSIGELQVRDDNLTFWSSLAAMVVAGPPRPHKWKARPAVLICRSRDVTADASPMILEGLDRAAEPVAPDDLTGATFADLLNEVEDLAGVRLRSAPGFEGFVVYAVGRELTWRALFEGLCASGRLRFTGSPAAGGLVVGPDPRLGRADSLRLAEEARDRTVPGLSAELRALLPGALDRAGLDELPLPVQQLLDGFDGALRALPEPGRSWLAARIRGLYGPELPLDADYEWLGHTDDLTIHLRLEYHFHLAACVPYRVADRETLRYVPSDPPETFFSELGATRDRPIFSTQLAMYRAY
jgi:hypothetical protein